MKKLHEPTDFKIGTVFMGDVNCKKFEIVNLFHPMYTTRKGAIRYKKELVVSYRDLKTGKIHTTDIETLCRIKITILEEL